MKQTHKLFLISLFTVVINPMATYGGVFSTDKQNNTNNSVNSIKSFFSNLIQSKNVQIIEEGGRCMIKIHCPGYAIENFKIEVDKHTRKLKVSAKRQDIREKRKEKEKENTKIYVYEKSKIYKKFHKTIDLPDNLKLDKIKAEYKNNYVIIELDKKGLTKKKRSSKNLCKG